ncbi:MAG TPA: lipocalin family protein [Caulobacteraceae bacterium]|nr:lipocalin family protein [Caulobacteraceae bacterium]
MKLTIAAALSALAFAPALAAAPAPQPAKPVPAALYSGRWYEIARTPNKMEADCQASTNDFANWSSGAFSVVQTCHRGANAPAKVMKVSGRVLPSSANAKMKLGILGGLIGGEYWILDRADNNTWAIMDRADGRYVWLLSRQPNLAPADKAAALAKLSSLGFPVNRLAFAATR